MPTQKPRTKVSLPGELWGAPVYRKHTGEPPTPPTHTQPDVPPVTAPEQTREASAGSRRWGPRAPQEPRPQRGGARAHPSLMHPTLGAATQEGSREGLGDLRGGW